MRYAPLAALAALCLSAPALATGGLQCTPVSGEGPVLDIVVGHGAGPAVTGVTLREGGRILTTHRPDGDPLVVQQAWIDSEHLWLDLVDAEATRYEARLRARFDAKARGRPAAGTLVRGGKSYRVRCVEA